MTEQRDLHITVLALVRVEGEGGLDVVLRQGRVESLELRIFEPPRFFEKFLEGRAFHEIPDAVARICGICPVAYQMSAVQAVEAAFGVTVTEWIKNMRRAVYCGEWIESHALHIHMLAAPDFFGCSSVVELAKQRRVEVERGLRLQRLGNDIITLFGGRSVHPVGVRVGGFAHAPRRADVAALRERLCAALPEAAELVQWTASWPLPVREQKFTQVALQHAQNYAIGDGVLITSTGERIDAAQFARRFHEEHMPHSTALHCTLDGQSYLVGPLARVNFNYDRLPVPVRQAIAATSVAFPSANMFHSVVARAVEIYFALWEAARILDDYDEPEQIAVPVNPRAATGVGMTEAPRGVLWHEYAFNERGEVLRARIVPPTSQNQARIEADLRENIEREGAQLNDDELRQLCETVIRNYDPCISCATHFLDLRVQRG